MYKDTIIEVKGVSQRFSRSMRHTLRYGIHDIFQQLLPSNSDGERKLRPGEFWALRDINFSLRAGESLGILGNNGAGKSTLLKLIAGIYRPTVGHIRVQGRIGAIVELGSSFSPNLSGRENIRLQALLHGYSPGLLNRKMDEILAFADLGDFIDSPVQHYSTGMRARLGFAVAVHGNPDILLVDEVLAVGDLSFQNKCLRLVEAFREQGGAVIYVGHNPFQMQAACKRGIILQRGCIQFDGSIVNAIDKILDGVAPAPHLVDGQSVAGDLPAQSNEQQSDRGNGPPFKVLSTAIAYHPPGKGQLQGSATIVFDVEVQRSDVRLNGMAAIFNQQGHQAIAVSISDAVVLSAGIHTLVMDIPSLPLLPGNYLLKLSLLDESTAFSLWNKGWSDKPIDFQIPGEGCQHGNIAKSLSSKIFMASHMDVKK
jgi:lipopolysaccharide transport system ATP-binding protein